MLLNYLAFDEKPTCVCLDHSNFVFCPSLPERSFLIVRLHKKK